MSVHEIKDKELHQIAATCIIYKDEKYLITRRKPEDKLFSNKWTVPGGGLTIDDYIATSPTHGKAWYHVVDKALRREIKEEVGIEVGKIEFLLDLVYVRSDNIPVLTLSYFAPYKSGNVVLLDEDANDVAWLSVEELSKYDFISGIKEEIEMVDKILKEKK